MNNISAGQSAIKEHLSNGAYTACNRKTSFAKNDFQDFKWLVENYPDNCCKKCLNRFLQKSK
jgi:hypothetical protein